MFKYYNANPRNRRVNDCTIRAISLATGRSWDETFEELSKFAQAQAIMPDDVIYIDEYLERKFKKICGCKNNIKISVGDFVNTHKIGTYLITMNGHITCCINGVVYDTFDPRDRLVWGIYKVK
mgnify:FL=1